jgi:anti-sigma factor RsiW
MIAMTCHEFVEALAELVADELSEAQTREMLEHRAGCRDCSKYEASYRQTIRLARTSMDASETIAAPMPPRLVESILRNRLSRGTKA